MMVSTRVLPTVRWLARTEYYRRWYGRLLLNLHGAVPIRREGVPVKSIRTAIALLRAGQVVGIFPEGGVKVGRESVVRGGALRGGAALLSIRTGAPIIPVVVLGTHALNRVAPWLPFKRGEVFLNFGQPLCAGDSVHRRLARLELTARLRSSFIDLYAELLTRAKLHDQEVP